MRPLAAHRLSRDRDNSRNHSTGQSGTVCARLIPVVGLLGFFQQFPRFGIAGCELDGCSQVLDGSRESLVLEQQFAERGVSPGMIGLERDGCAE